MITIQIPECNSLVALRRLFSMTIVSLGLKRDKLDNPILLTIYKVAISEESSEIL